MEVLYGPSRTMPPRWQPGEIPGFRRLQTKQPGAERRAHGGTVTFTREGKPLLTVAGPITRDTSLDFDGDVRIQGDVNEDATVQVRGDVEITGSVNGGTVHSSGSIKVKRAVRHGRLEAIRDISVESAEMASLHCEGDLSVRGDLRFCAAEVGGKARVGGRVIGGHLVADLGVRALAIGNRNGVRTQVMVVPEARRRVRKALLESELARENARMAVCHGISRRLSTRTSEGALSARLYLTEWERRHARVAEGRLLELSVLAAHPAPPTGPTITVDVGVFPGVEIQIREATLLVDRLLPPVQLAERDGQIVPRRGSGNRAPDMRPQGRARKPHAGVPGNPSGDERMMSDLPAPDPTGWSPRMASAPTLR